MTTAGAARRAYSSANVAHANCNVRAKCIRMTTIRERLRRVGRSIVPPQSRASVHTSSPEPVMPRFLLLTSLVALSSFASAHDTQIRPDAVMLRTPDVSRDTIVFRYASRLWLVDKQGGIARSLSSPAGLLNRDRMVSTRDIAQKLSTVTVGGGDSG